jgi:chromosome segregation ATPase
MDKQNGWNEYSRLVLNELETLSGGIAGINREIQEIRQELIALKTKEDRIDDLVAWKARVDEVASATQLKEMKDELSDLQIQKESVEALSDWKRKIDEISSPTQLGKLSSEVSDLKTFKVKAITVFAVIQFGMALAVAWSKIFN